MISDNFYLSKYKFCDPQIVSPVADDLKISVVIPAYAEENLIRTLESFQTKKDLSFSVEVIVVINASETDSEENKNLNVRCYETGKHWASKQNSEKIKYHFILNNALPKKHSGVGLARKIGMDEAVFRFHQIGFDGVIVCADADAFYENDYLEKLYQHFFIDHPKTNGCSIYFEHPLNGDEYDFKIYEGILRYELFLRYYKNALEWCGFPFAYHTIGSSMAARSSAYQKCGGMNRRQAGEDFYFLQKIIGLGNFTEMNSTVVHPSPRPSHRVPFGTGKAVSDWMKKEENTWNVYAIEVFDVLREFNLQIENLYLSNSSNSLKVHPLFKKFLDQNHFEEKLREIKSNSSSLEFFKKRFYNWMDGFLVLKATHFLRDEGLGTSDVEIASIELLQRLKLKSEPGMKSLLSVFRNIDRKGIK